MKITDQKIKEVLSEEVLSQIQDKSVQSIIREIIFSKNNNVYWQEVQSIIKENMPEINFLNSSERV